MTPVAVGEGRDVLGDPIRSVVWLARRLAAFGAGLKSDDVVLAGRSSGTAGLRLAARMGCATSTDGIDAVTGSDIDVVFDPSNASAHPRHELLAALAPGPMVTLNRHRRPRHGLRPGHRPGTARRRRERRRPGHHRLDAVRAHLLEQAGQPDAAREHFQRASQRTLSVPEQRYLLHRATRR